MILRNVGTMSFLISLFVTLYFSLPVKFEFAGICNMTLLFLGGYRNVYSFLLFGYDKWCAIRGKYRVSEKELLNGASYFGWIGAICGMIFFVHKVKKMYFIQHIAEQAVINCFFVGLFVIVKNVLP
jgi:uncharacterized membrane protein YsdA (DUF1294 family)